MGWTLRPYQKKFSRNLAKSLLENMAVIACAPTGSGKSKIMASIATKAIESKAREGEEKKTVLIITESKKIYGQLKDELPIVNINPEARNVHVTPGRVYLAMAQTLVRRKKLIEEFAELGLGLIIMNDEAHIGTATNLLINFVGKCYLLGFTATPDYRAAKHLPILYKDCVQACQVDELIQSGFLCTYRHIARDKANLDILEMRGGDYSDETNEKAFSTSEVYDGLLEDLSKQTFKKAMVFTASIKQCEETYQQLIENGFKACRYHSGNEDYPLKNPDFELDKFITLDLCNICVSVSSLTKGFDFPAIDLVCLLRKTSSLPLYLQMIGRASRPVYKFDDDGNIIEKIKTSFIVLDYGSHWKSLGLYWEDRDWTTAWQPPKNKRKKEPGGGVSSVKACENCDELIAVQARTCPECGHVYPEIKKELEIGEAIEVTKSYTDLIGKLTSELNARELAIYAKIKNKRRHAIRIAMYHEFKSPGFVKSFADEMGLCKDWTRATENEARIKQIKEFADLELK